MPKTDRLIVLFLVGLFFCQISSFAQKYDLPVRVKAVADVQQLGYDRYAVREFLDVYNDDHNQALYIDSVTADTWRGHQKHEQNQNWSNNGQIIEIPPGKVKRVAERKRLISGRKGRNWWVRWIRFKIETNRGTFVSNFVASPFKAPERVDIELKQPEIDSLSEPAELIPDRAQDRQ